MSRRTWPPMGHEERLKKNIYTICEAFGPHWHVYNVQATSGTTLGDEHYGGHNYRLDLEKVECTSNVLQIMHASCSHMIKSCRAQGYDYKGPQYMSSYYLQSNTVKIWENNFNPYRDLTQWPPYYGANYVPDPGPLKVAREGS